MGAVLALLWASHEEYNRPRPEPVAAPLAVRVYARRCLIDLCQEKEAAEFRECRAWLLQCAVRGLMEPEAFLTVISDLRPAE